MFKDSLFHIADCRVLPGENGNNLRIESIVAINGNHSIFSGHFPGNPVVPGVCLIQILLVLLTNARQQKIFLSEIEYIKFLYPINPLVNNTLIYDISVRNLDPGKFNVNCSLTADTRISMKLKGLFSFQI